MRAAWLVVALALGLAPRAAAQGALDALAEGIRRYDERDFAGALPSFRSAWEQTRSPNARLWLGRSLRELGALPEAYLELRGTFHDAARASETDPKYVKTRDAAAVESGLLALRVGQLLVVLEGTVADRAAVELDGRPLAREGIAEPIPRLPGRARLVATAPGAPPVERALVVEAGKTHVVALRIEPPAPASAAPVAPEPTAATIELGTLGLVVAGIGAAGMVLFGATAIAAEHDFSTLEEICGGARCTDPDLADVVDRGRTLETISNVGLGVGIAGLALGLPLVVLGWPAGADAEARALAPTPIGSELGGRIGVRGRW
jgi:hypothetical protein